MDLFSQRRRGLVLPLLIALISFILLLSIYYYPAAENVVGYFGFRHGSSWDLAHGHQSWDDPTIIKEHLAQLASSAKASQPKPTDTSHASIPPDCKSLPGATYILLILKTGNTELPVKLPAHLSTSLSCTRNSLIVSDLEQTFAGQPIHDILRSINTSIKSTAPEFEFARTLAAYRDSGVDVTATFTPDQLKTAWTLDKWKNIPALRLAVEMFPEVKWYVFIDADTYLSFPNMLHVVSTLDPGVPLYTGYEVGSGSVTFAQGGAGYLISHVAARMFVEEFDNGGKERWEEKTLRAPFGDGMLGLAMRESGVPFQSLAQGRIFQDNPVWMFGGWANLWCQPAVSWHHVGPNEVQEIWDWERHLLETRGTGVITFGDVFEGLVEPMIRIGKRAGWDNLAGRKVLMKVGESSTEEERGAWNGLEELDVDPLSTWDACEKACQLNRGCLSWMFGPGRCVLDDGVKLGRKTEGEINEHGKAVSGWNIARIQQWKERIGKCD